MDHLMILQSCEQVGIDSVQKLTKTVESQARSPYLDSKQPGSSSHPFRDVQRFDLIPRNSSAIGPGVVSPTKARTATNWLNVWMLDSASSKPCKKAASTIT